MTSPSRDGAVLFFAVNGTDCDLTCRHLGPDFWPDNSPRTPVPCGKPMVGVSADDGTPLCAECITDPEDEGHVLDSSTMRAIQFAKRRHEEAKIRGHKR
jgi:hypothetical protein